MEDRTYNGWTNYETWAVGLYLDGNYDGEGTYHAVLKIIRDAVERTDAPIEALYSLEISLKDFVEESLVELDGLASDLLSAALSEVNWRELAEAKLDEIEES